MVLIDDNSKALKIGDPMPPFALPDVKTGSIVDSATFGDAATVIIFTCNHCPYAKAVEDRLIALHDEFRPGDNVGFILISSNDAKAYPDDAPEKMKERAAEKGFPFPYCHDATQETAKAFGALCTPHCFVFDAVRRLRYMGRVDDNWKDESAVKERTLRNAIVAVLEGKDPPKTTANALGCSIKWKQ